MEKRNLELYVHIPFCVRKCGYCDFLSMAAGAGPQAALTHREYMDQLVREIRCQSALCREYQVRTVFLGGGTPSILEPSLIEMLMNEIRENFTVCSDAEVTIECNPGTLNKGKAVSYAQYGINRMSLGLQSADDWELNQLGRIHTYQDFLESYQQARQAGFTNINVDLMYALPGQTVKSWERTLKKVLLLRPEHISAYSLIIEEGTPFYERYRGRDEIEALKRNKKHVPQSFPESPWPKLRVPDYNFDESGGTWVPLPDEDTERCMDRMTREILAAHGMRRYEVSNYARKDYICRHNVGYWTGVEYLGLGLGASSYTQLCRFHNERDFDAYMKADFTKGFTQENIGLLRQEFQQLSVSEMMEEFMFLGLRMVEGVSVADFYQRFGHNIYDIYGDVIRRQIRLGVLENRQGYLSLTDYGIDVSNQVMAQYLL